MRRCLPSCHQPLTGLHHRLPFDATAATHGKHRTGPPGHSSTLPRLLRFGRGCRFPADMRGNYADRQLVLLPPWAPPHYLNTGTLLIRRHLTRVTGYCYHTLCRSTLAGRMRISPPYLTRPTAPCGLPFWHYRPHVQFTHRPRAQAPPPRVFPRRYPTMPAPPAAGWTFPAAATLHGTGAPFRCLPYPGAIPAPQAPSRQF